MTSLFYSDILDVFCIFHLGKWFLTLEIRALHLNIFAKTNTVSTRNCFGKISWHCPFKKQSTEPSDFIIEFSVCACPVVPGSGSAWKAWNPTLQVQVILNIQCPITVATIHIPHVQNFCSGLISDKGPRGGGEKTIKEVLKRFYCPFQIQITGFQMENKMLQLIQDSRLKWNLTWQKKITIDELHSYKIEPNLCIFYDAKA